MSGRAFVPPWDDKFYLLQAHRQPLPANVASHFIDTFTQPGDLVVDPFVASDAIVRVAIERGRRIVASDSNPLVAWAARIQATLPPARDINAALVRLGETTKEAESLRAYLDKLFSSQCATCGGPVQVEHFVHRREGDKSMLAQKVYTCETCGARRDDVTEADRQRAADAAPHGLNYHLLVQRLIADDASNSARIKALLKLYTPRNLAALAALSQKLDAEFRNDPARNLLAALMLHALDIGSSLYPSPYELPARQVPSEFIEVNIWHALENAAHGLSEHAPGLRLAAEPEQVVRGIAPAAFVGPGGARLLRDKLAGADAGLVLSSPARLDPMFWELSFLWTRWLFGRNAALPLEPLMDEKRQRWSWYGEALTNALEDTLSLMRPNGQLVVAFPSGSHAMIEALLLAASNKFALDDLAFRPARGANRTTEFGAVRGDYQVIWKREETATTPAAASQLAPTVRSASLLAAVQVLDARAEPLVYSWLHHAALDRMARDGTLATALAAKYREGDNAFQFLRHRMEEGFKEGYIHDLDHWEEKDRVLWMTRLNAPGTQTETELAPLAERVELRVQEILRANRQVPADDLDRLILNEFTGLEIPEVELVEIAALAYSERQGNDYIWRDADVPQDLLRARELVMELGERLGMEVLHDVPPYDVLWRAEKTIPGSATGDITETQVYEDIYGFVFRGRVNLLSLVLERALLLKGLVVLPESQVGMTRERLRREPRWSKQLERAGWEFLRIPFVEMLLNEDLATPPEFHLAWGLDPLLASGKEQLELF